jgi:methionyl aminopeptidase
MERNAARLKNGEDIKKIHDAGRIISDVFKILSGFSFSGMTTVELDRIVESFIHKNKARSAFKTVKGYNHATCISINNEVVHGIPSKKKLIKNGDIVKVDTGVVLNGYFADSCKTFPVGEISNNALNLINTAVDCLNAAIKQMTSGARAGDVGSAIQDCAENRGYSVVRDFTGHGTGFSLHESPSIPHYGIKGTGVKLVEGMVIAIEPMINEGTYEVETLSDGWTAVTSDGRLSAQFEHTVAVTSNGPIILTS